MKILLPFDGSPYTAKVLSYLQSDSRFCVPGDEYALLNVQPPLPRYAASVLGHAVVEDHHREESELALQEAVAFFSKTDRKHQTVMRVGDAGDEIARFAEAWPADLVIMGAHGYGAVANMFLGSVTQRVLAKCTKPVLVIR